ncbi:glyoxylase-like metal-dependent hydrolase (beta-lactamase superfamily II) [Kribbella amoyensis]|uniref:Glyoxylase-like metal-dependent hydrolase (Beta-lactamase superfamily II) n=1 Tax=Kribbella amoyensis TaxID=996641 RepID=A0A561BR27_9ACTN|nr:MBL fold metallo-hydrolase [Kribbella amoyensis]TWD81243.1 glyoxylase-like metal-dependent hydrolase (beta-lactamase superfamily II) [Kribbella amoyensis]
MTLRTQRVGANLHAVEDSCVVYLLVDPTTRSAVAVDVGSGRWLSHLAELGIDRITDVLVTHHHRDQVEGLPLLAAAGARIWVPETELDLIADVERIWQRRTVVNNYDLRTDRYSLLEPVAVTGAMRDYSTRQIGHLEVTTLPTPGHTAGSVTYLIDGQAFVGDLVHSPGKVWSAAALQWSYVGLEGAALTRASLVQLLDHDPSVLLPSHGDPMTDPADTVDRTCRALGDLIEVRLGQPSGLLEKLADPFVEISPHLLMNRTSESRSYVLLSDSGTALVIDYGYDLTTGIPQGGERYTVRPWLPSVRALHRDYGIDRVEVAVPTHYHDDHVAAFNLLRDVEGTEVWASSPVAAVLEDPSAYDLPCLWYEPIPCERHIPDGTSVRWREYELEMHALPGHTLYASAVGFTVDGKRVLATGDQQTGTYRPGVEAEIPNFQYANLFRPDDYAASAALYRRLQPDLMITGHWDPRVVTGEYLDELTRIGDEVARVHRELLRPDDPVFAGPARITPYRIDAVDGQPFEVTVIADGSAELVVPAGWDCKQVAPDRFVVVPHVDRPVRRARIAAAVTRAGKYLGQSAEALVDVRL